MQELRLKRLIALTLCIGLIGQAPTAVGEPQGELRSLKMNNAQARAAAWRALQLGKPTLTLEIASALAKTTPNDFELVFLQAQALLALGKNHAATAAARHAYQSADDQGKRFDAAHLVAKAHFAQGSQTRAQFWLRRATQIAPDAHAQELSKRDFQFIRRNKPLATKAFFSLFPSSNINNGSLNDTIIIGSEQFHVPVSGQPHSGTGLTAGFETTYRHQFDARNSLRLGLFALGTTYKLSSAAKALGSGKTGSDFAFATIEARLGLTHLPKNMQKTGWGRLNFNAALGHSWYGGDPLSVHYRADIKKEYRFSHRAVTDMGIGFNVQNRLDNANNTSKSTNIKMGLTRFMAKGQSIRYGLNVRNSKSDSSLSRYTEFGADLRYALPEMAWNIRPTLTLSYQHTDFTDFAIGAIKRADDKISANLSLFFPKISYYGFAPNVNLSVNRNDSSIDIYSTKDMRMSIGVNSTF